MTVNYWETNRNQLSLGMVPRVTEFLGCNPLPEAEANEALGERIVRVRRAVGILQKDLVQEIGVDPTTLARWEGGDHKPRLTVWYELSELSCGPEIQAHESP